MRTCTRHHTSRDTKHEAKWGRERGPYGWTRSGSTSRPFFYIHKLQKNTRTTISKNNEKWKLNLTASTLLFFPTTFRCCGRVLRRRGKQKDTQQKVGYRHTRLQHRVRSSPKHNLQPDIRGGTAIRVRRERERGGTRQSALQYEAELTVLPAPLMPHQNRLCLIFLSMCPTGEGFISISLSLRIQVKDASRGLRLAHSRDRRHALLRAGKRLREPAVGIAIFLTAP